jgi:hypothetical protein
MALEPPYVQIPLHCPFSCSTNSANPKLSPDPYETASAASFSTASPKMIEPLRFAAPMAVPIYSSPSIFHITVYVAPFYLDSDRTIIRRTITWTDASNIVNSNWLSDCCLNADKEKCGCQDYKQFHGFSSFLQKFVCMSLSPSPLGTQARLPEPGNSL